MKKNQQKKNSLNLPTGGGISIQVPQGLSYPNLRVNALLIGLWFSRNMLYFSLILMLVNILLFIWCTIYGESLFNIFPNMNEIKVILSDSFDNKLYMDASSNENINTSSVDGGSITGNENTNTSSGNGESTISNENTHINTNNTSGESTASNENVESSTNNEQDTYSDASSASHLDHTCPCVTEPGHPGCDCDHPLAYIGNNISDRENRCHLCSGYGATTRCAVCDCLLHIYCLPHDCVIESDPED